MATVRILKGENKFIIIRKMMALVRNADENEKARILTFFEQDLTVPTSCFSPTGNLLKKENTKVAALVGERI